MQVSVCHGKGWISATKPRSTSSVMPRFCSALSRLAVSTTSILPVRASAWL
jgi:hypothetical protein